MEGAGCWLAVAMGTGLAVGWKGGEAAAASAVGWEAEAAAEQGWAHAVAGGWPLQGPAVGRPHCRR